MGIRGLSSFMSKTPNICKSFKLHDTTVIFDGNNLMIALYCKYELDFKYGGEYERYYDCVRKYMSTFLECNIKPIMIIDGCHGKSARKLNCLIERAEKSLVRAQNIDRVSEI